MPASSFRCSIFCAAVLLSGYIVSCSPNKTPHTGTTAAITKTPAGTSKQEDFGTFFKKFSSDSVFQIARVKFPLKIITDSEDGTSTRFLSKSKWQYVSFDKGKNDENVYRKKIINERLINIEFTVKETGVFVNHYFTLQSEKWLLAYVVDGSD